VFKNKFNIQVP